MEVEMSKPLVVASNMLNERPQLDEWYENMLCIADGGILIVDGGSTDGTIEFFEKRKSAGLVLIVDKIIQTEGYGPARNHLRLSTRKYFPEAHWMVYFDADERIDPADFFTFRAIKENLIDNCDVVALPRIDWLDKERTAAARDWRAYPDYQARMTRLHSTLSYVRRLHEQVVDFRGMYAEMTNPKVNHFHRVAGQEKRDQVGKLCAKLHAEDSEWGTSYPAHHKEAEYFKRYQEEGL
jgi:glycosyltransferase involved in cell wall biosynthesis